MGTATSEAKVAGMSLAEPEERIYTQSERSPRAEPAEEESVSRSRVDISPGGPAEISYAR